MQLILQVIDKYNFISVFIIRFVQSVLLVESKDKRVEIGVNMC